MTILCKHCGNEVKLHDAKSTEDGDIICGRCAREHYIKCSNCDNYIRADLHRRLCKVCDSIVYRKSLNSYSTKPIPRFQGKKSSTDNGVRFFGLEIELNHVAPASAFALFNELYKDQLIYNKHDGSISDGVEVVVNPHDYYSIKKTLSRMQKGFEEIKKVRGYTDNAGIHIHVNRKSIDPIDIYKLGYLLNYKMPDDHKRLIYYISGRNSTSTDTTSYFSYATIGGIRTKKHLNSNPERYSAVNMQNRDTIEFRIFKTIADTDTIVMYVDFVNACLDYVHTHGFKDMNVGKFMDWILRNVKSDLLIHRIKTFMKYNKDKIKVSDNIYKIDINKLKGVKVDRYNDVISSLRACTDTQEVNEVLDWYSSNEGYCSLGYLRGRGFSDFSKKCSLIPKLEKALKSVLINKIMKGIEQCA